MKTIGTQGVLETVNVIFCSYGTEIANSSQCWLFPVHRSGLGCDALSVSNKLLGTVNASHFNDK